MTRTNKQNKNNKNKDKANNITFLEETKMRAYAMTATNHDGHNHDGHKLRRPQTMTMTATAMKNVKN